MMNKEEQRAEIKRLKEHTGLTLFECKKILGECEFNYEDAIILARNSSPVHALINVRSTLTGEKYKDDKYIIVFFNTLKGSRTYHILDNDKLTPQGYDIEGLNVFIHAEDLDKGLLQPVPIIASWFIRVLNKKTCNKINEYNESRELIKSYYELGNIDRNVFMIDITDKNNCLTIKNYKYGLPFIDKDKSIRYYLFNDFISVDRRLCQVYKDCKLAESKSVNISLCKSNPIHAFAMIDLYSRLVILIETIYNDPDNREFTIKF